MDFFEHAPIHDTSRKMYNTRLNEWIEFMPNHFKSITNIVMLPDLALRVLNDRIRTNTASSRHMYIVAVLSFIRHHITQLCEHLTKDVALPLRERWVTINAENEAPIIQRRLENKPTVLQQSKGGSKLSFNEIIEKRDELPIGSIERLLIAMYTMIPPCRADYFAMEVIRGEVQPTAKNYLRIRSDDEKSGVQMETVLRDFKTAKIFKEIRNELPVELIKEVEASLEKTPRGYLFINANGKPHTRNSFTMWSRRVLSRVFGTDFTLVFFRHAFATHYVMNVDLRTLTDAQIKEISDKLGHSTEMFRAYRWIRGEEVESGGESDEE
jgi:integrase